MAEKGEESSKPVEKYEVVFDEATGLKHYPFPLEQVPRLHWDDPTADHLMTHEMPVVLTGTELVEPALRWTLPYLEDNIGSSKHTVYISKTKKFLYFDDKKVNNVPDFREPMKKREWTFSKFVDELKGHIDRTDEYLYYQDTLTDTVGTSIKHDFVHFNWRWLNDRKKRYNWGQLTTNLLLIGQPGNISPCHYDEQHNYFCQVMGEKRCMLFSPSNFDKLYPFPVAHPCDRQTQVDFNNPDFEKFPNFRDVKGYECMVKPGEVLYIPMYWWHWIEGLPKGGITISITFWYRSGPVPNKIQYPLNDQQKTAITRNIEKMLHEALQDPAEVAPLLRMIVEGRYI
ncbi:hypoxia-inducible factor 1-alpha inhibitor-like [Halichondria panicea]|uniref:hypoxia-inducible factor 1-alpha inhibitor-like n=1 Tax=Halichondria panicea TaxID=6063 RepID=UPI00312BC07A